MSDIKVSVIVPVYNTKPFLKRCLDSICGQTLKEIEILCIDDGSCDGSDEILEDYAKRDGRVKVFYNKHTGHGAASARNYGLAKAEGLYLSFLDSDDYFDITMLQKAYDKAQTLAADIVMYDAQFFEDGTGKFIYSKDVLQIDMIPKKEAFSGTDFPREIFISTIGAAWSMLYRHEFVKKYGLSFQSLYHADDFFFTYSAMAAAKRITIINEKMVFYRKENENSQSANKSIAPLAAVQACEALKKWLEKEKLYSIYEQGFHNVAVRYCNFYLETMDNWGGFKILYDALKEKYFRKFGFDKIQKQELVFEGLYDWLKKIEKFGKEEYLFEYAYNRNKVFTYQTDKLFPSGLIEPGERIIIYGAGDSGKAYYIQNIINNYCNIVGWIDKKSDQMYKPIESIKIISKETFDKILIAIDSREIAEQVKSDLIQLGVEENRILWSRFDPKTARYVR